MVMFSITGEIIKRWLQFWQTSTRMEYMQRGKSPYSKFGQRLSEIRKELKESIHEVSGAIEVDNGLIEKFEKGEDRPSEDLLMLLISHFDVQDEEADELFELAGYSLDDSSESNLQMQPIVVVPVDSRIVYTDSAQISINESGVVLGFSQNAINNQPAIISRVGMSLEHAKELSNLLQESIQKAEEPKTTKLLSSSKKSVRTTKKPK